MKHADGELSGREARDPKAAVVPQAVAETTALRDARTAAAKPAKATKKTAAKKV